MHFITKNKLSGCLLSKVERLECLLSPEKCPVTVQYRFMHKIFTLNRYHAFKSVAAVHAAAVDFYTKWYMEIFAEIHMYSISVSALCFL